MPLGPRNAEKVLAFATDYAKGRWLYLTTTHFHRRGAALTRNDEFLWDCRRSGSARLSVAIEDRGVQRRY